MIETLEEIVRRDPASAAQVDLAMAYHRAERTDEAVRLLDEVLVSAPSAPGAYEAQARIAFLAGPGSRRAASRRDAARAVADVFRASIADRGR